MRANSQSRSNVVFELVSLNPNPIWGNPKNWYFTGCGIEKFVATASLTIVSNVWLLGKLSSRTRDRLCMVGGFIEGRMSFIDLSINRQQQLGE